MKIIRQSPNELAAPTNPPKPIKRGKGEVVAVRLPNWLGDAVMALPAVYQLAGEYKRIIAVVPPQIRGLAESIECIDQVIVLSSAHKSWSRYDIQAVKNCGADIALMFNNSLRDAWYFRRAGISNLYGAAKRGRSILLKEAFHFPKIRKRELNFLHHARKYASMATAIGGKIWSGEFPKIRISPSPERHHPMLVLAPGAAYGAAKRWSADSFGGVANLFLAKYPTGVVAIVGSPSEDIIAQEVISCIKNSEQVENLCGKTNFQELVSLLNSADVCVANDSGVMHLAASLGVAGAVVFGPTDYASTAPVSKDWIVIFSEYPCAPCFERSCPKYPEPACMRAVSAEQLFAQVETLLAEKI